MLRSDIIEHVSVLLDLEGNPDQVAAFAAAADIGTGVLTPVGVLDPAALSQFGRLDLLIAMDRLKSWADAQQQRTLAAMAAAPAPITAPVSGRGGARDNQWVREEVGCALRIPFGAAAALLHNATDLVGRLPDTLDALERGVLRPGQARVLVESVRNLDDDTAAAVQARILPGAGTQTVAELRRATRRAVLSADPVGQQTRHAHAVADRRVEVFPADDGMATLWALLPADAATTVLAALGVCADQARQLADGRSADQLRADALLDLALNTATGTGTATGSGTASARGPAVHVTVALSTLLGVDEQPGDLDGHGPIPAALARRIAADPSGTWYRLITDTHGQLLDHGRTTYRPPASLRDHVITRDRTCRMPGCHRRARRSELDHLAAWDDGGTTSALNLHALCPRHHHLKHDTGWKVTRTPDGTTHWTSPLGRRYHKPPDPLPQDTTTTTTDPDDEPPPF